MAFAAAWEASRPEIFEDFVDAKRGVWVLYDPSIAECPLHYPSLAAAVTQAPVPIQAPAGMGAHLRKAGFRCEVSEGPAPELGNCRDEQPLSRCQFGVAQPVLRESFDFCWSLARDAHDAATVDRASADLVLSLERKGLYFLSDASTGAVFYFAPVASRWILVAVDNTDYTIHVHSASTPP